MAGVRRLGTVITKEPLLPGLHLKLPFIDQPDKLQVSAKYAAHRQSARLHRRQSVRDHQRRRRHANSPRRGSEASL